MSCLLGDYKDIRSKLSEGLHLIIYTQTTVNYIKQLGYIANIFLSEKEAACSFIANNSL
jgi:hypothetical protein